MLKYSFLLSLFFLLSCDKGLAPLPQSQLASISGKVHYTGTPKDSVKILAIVLVQPISPYPPSILIAGFNTTFLTFLLSSTSLTDTSYSISVKPDTVYHYLGVAQNFGDVFKDWKVVAFMHDDKDSATYFKLNPGEQRTGVDITVNFDSLPRQPFIP